MSDRVTLTAEPRTVVGKQVKQLRRENIIPAIIYGQQEPINIQLDNRSLRRALRITGTTQLIELDVNGDKRTVLTREIQTHVTRGDLIHIDFMEVDMKATITSEAELVLEGEVNTEVAGLGVITQPQRSVDIECLPDALVSEIAVDVTLIKTVDDSITVADLVVPEGVTILTDPETVVARVEIAQEEEEEEEESEESFLETSAADDVEVISRGKKEDEEF